MGGGVAGRVVRGEARVGGGVGRVSRAGGGAVVQRRRGPRVQRRGQRGERPRRVARRHLAVERGEARVVEVRRDPEAVRRRVGRDVARLQRLRKNLQRSLETFTLVGGQRNNLRSAEPNLQYYHSSMKLSRSPINKD